MNIIDKSLYLYDVPTGFNCLNIFLHKSLFEQVLDESTSHKMNEQFSFYVTWPITCHRLWTCFIPGNSFCFQQAAVYGIIKFVPYILNIRDKYILWWYVKKHETNFHNARLPGFSVKKPMAVINCGPYALTTSFTVHVQCWNFPSTKFALRVQKFIHLHIGSIGPFLSNCFKILYMYASNISRPNFQEKMAIWFTIWSTMWNDGP